MSLLLTRVCEAQDLQKYMKKTMFLSVLSLFWELQQKEC